MFAEKVPDEEDKGERSSTWMNPRGQRVGPNIKRGSPAARGGRKTSRDDDGDVDDDVDVDVDDDDVDNNDDDDDGGGFGATSTLSPTTASKAWSAREKKEGGGVRRPTEAP